MSLSVSVPSRWIGLLSATLLMTGSITAKNQYDDSSLKETIKTALTKVAEVPGFSGTISASLSGETIVNIHTGLANQKTSKPVSSDTYFNLASASKLFTGFILHQTLSDKGLDFDTPVRTILPGLDVSDQLTIAHLMKHETNIHGLIYSNVSEEERSAAQSNADFYQLIKKYLSNQIEPVTKRFRYRNEHYIIAGQVIEVLSGQPFEKVLEQLVIDSGATGNVFIGKRKALGDKASIPYVPENFDRTYMRDPVKKAKLHEHYPREYLSPLGEQVTTAGGGLYVTSAGLGKILEYVSNQKQALHAICALDVIKSKDTGARTRGFGCHGTRLENHEGINFVSMGHGGGAPGMQTVISFYPDFNLVLSVLSNHQGRAMPIKNALEQALKAF